MLNAKKGFTLSELLVSLAVLGLIAAFAIPKVLTSVGNSSFLANAKETMATISTAYDSVKVGDGNGASAVTSMVNTALTLPYAVPTCVAVCTAAETLAIATANAANSVSNYSIIQKMSFSAMGTYTEQAAATGDTFTASATAPTAASSNAVRFGTGVILQFHGSDLMGSDTTNVAKGRLTFNVDADGVGPLKGFNVILGSDGRIFAPANPTALTGPYALYTGGTAGGTELTLHGVTAPYDTVYAALNPSGILS